MKYIEGKPRTQIPIFTTCLEEAIHPDNEVRLIDMFVESLPLKEIGFEMDFTENGRPAYHPKDLLKLYIYGYLNRIRSSRHLEKECHRNLEVMWLMRGLAPDHNTISNFRKCNPKAIKKVFRSTVKMAADFHLIGGLLIGGDSTKVRAQNSKKNNFNPKKIDRHIAYIDAKVEEYNAALASEDSDGQEGEKQGLLKDKLNRHKLQRKKYEAMQQSLAESGDTQISTSDPHSRQMITRNNITEVAYNIQSTTDAKHNLPIDFKVTNENDSKAMGGMLRRATTILGHNEFTALYDKGYHTGGEFASAQQQGVEVMVAYPDVASHAPDLAYDIEHFQYQAETDTYICPAGNILTTNGSWYNKSRGKSTNKIKQYKTKACLSCEYFERCTKNKAGRVLERSEHAQLIEENKKRVDANPELYRRRQAIVEHPFGIIKRQWGFNYIMTKKTIQHASSDVGLIFTAYNLRRIFNILNKNLLKSYLRSLCFLFLTFCDDFKPRRTMEIYLYYPII